MMELKSLMLGLMVTGAIIGIVGFYGSIGERYGVGAATNLSTTAVYSETEEFINSTYKSVTNTTTIFTGTPLGAYIDPLAGGIIAVGKIFITFTKIPALYLNLIQSVTTAFGEVGISIPIWFVMIIVTSITLIIIFAIINFIRSGSKID